MSPRKPQSESDGLLSRLASKATVPQAAGLAFIASMANADVRSEVMNTLMPQAHAAEDWQDQGTENNANADGEYIWCFGGDPNGVHVRQIWDFGSGVSTTQIHDGTETGTHVDGLDAAIAAYDPSINTQEICVQDVDPALDQIKFQNFGEGLGFIVNGYVNTGAISRIAYLDGSEVYTGNLHNGRAFAPSWNGGDIGAFEQFEGADPTEYYVHPTDDLVTLVVNPDTRQVFAAKDFLTGQVYKYDNAYPGSASVTESTLTGVTGEPRSWKDADASSDYNRFATLTDGETHIVLDMDSGTVVDPDADLDGYTVTAGGDCNDADAAIHPGATEMCDGVDNNCDGSTDGSDAADAATWYLDHDGDGVGGAVTQVACDRPDGYVPEGGDYDDNDPLVQNPPGACESGEESADGSFEVGEVICAPQGSATVYGGEVEYYSDVDAAETADAGDWLEIVGTLGLDSSSYQTTYTVTPSEDFRGGFGLGILDDAIMRSPPPATGSINFLAIRVDAGTVILYNTETKTSEVLDPGYHTVATEDLVVDTGDTGGDDTDDTGSGDDTDTGTDDTGPVIDSGDSVDSGDSESGDDTGGNEDTGDGGDGGCGEGCQSCGITPMPDSSVAVFGLAMAGGLALRRRRR